MGAFDIASWLWPDASQGRAPTSTVKLDRANPLLAGLADYIVPSDPSTFSVASGTLAQKYDPLGLAFSGTMRLDGKKNAVTTSAPYTLICIARMPATLSGTLVACSLEGTFTGSATPWMGYNAGEGVTVSNSETDTFITGTASALYVLCGVYSPAGYTAYFNGVPQGTVTTNPSTGTTATLCVMDYNGGGFSFTGNVLGALAFNRALSPGEIAALGTPQAVFSLFQPAPLGVAMPASTSANSAVISGTFGALSSSFSASQTASAAAASALALTTTAAANRSSAASGASTFGGLSAATTAGATTAAVAASSLGALSSALAGTQSRAAVGASALGALATSVTATGQAAGSAIVSSTFGALASSGQATQSRSAAATASLVAASAATAPQQASASVASTLGALSTSITVLDIAADQAIVSGVLGALSSSGVVAQKASASALSALSILTQVNASTSRQAAVSASIGALQCSATASESQAASANGVLGALATNIAVAPPYTATVSGSLGALSSSIFATLGAAVDPVVFMVLPETRGISVSAEARSYTVLPESREYVVST